MSHTAAMPLLREELVFTDLSPTVFGVRYWAHGRQRGGVVTCTAADVETFAHDFSAALSQRTGVIVQYVTFERYYSWQSVLPVASRTGVAA